MKFARWAFVAFSAGSFVASQAFAAGDPVAGREKAYTCFGCHGVAGYSNAYPDYRVPKLGGQNADYIIAALKDYKTGARSHPTMQGQASTLSDQDMENIAAFFANAPHAEE
jgi:cytochrome c553